MTALFGFSAIPQIVQQAFFRVGKIKIRRLNMPRDESWQVLATPGCVNFAIATQSAPPGRPTKPHSQEWLCYWCGSRPLAFRTGGTAGPVRNLISDMAAAASCAFVAAPAAKLM